MRFWCLAVAVATFYPQSHCGRVKKWFTAASDGGPCAKLFLNGHKPHGLERMAVPMDHTCQCSGSNCFYVAVLRQHRQIPIYWAYSVQEERSYSDSAEEFAQWISNWYTDPGVISAILRRNGSIIFKKNATNAPGFTYIVSGIVPLNGEDWSGITEQANRTAVTWSAYHHSGAGKTFEGAIIKKNRGASDWVKISVKQLGKILGEKFVTTEPVEIFCSDAGTSAGQHFERTDDGQAETGVRAEVFAGESGFQLAFQEEDAASLKNEKKQEAERGETARLGLEAMTRIDYIQPETVGRKPARLKDILQMQVLRMQKRKRKSEIGITLTEQISVFLRRKCMQKCNKVLCIGGGGTGNPGTKHGDPGLRPWKEDKTVEERPEPSVTPPRNSKPRNQTGPPRGNDEGTRPPANDKHGDVGSPPETIHFEITPYDMKDAPHIMSGHVNGGVQSNGRGIFADEQKSSSWSSATNVQDVRRILEEDAGCNTTVPVRSRCVGLVHHTAAALQRCSFRTTALQSKQSRRRRKPCTALQTQSRKQEKESHFYFFDPNMYKTREANGRCRGLVHPSRKCRGRRLRTLHQKRTLEK